MEQLTNEIITNLNKDKIIKDNKDCFFVINDNNKKQLIQPNSANNSTIKRKKSFDLTLLSNSICYQEYFDNEAYLNSPNNNLYSLLSSYKIPAQNDEKFIEFLKTKNDLKLLELYCLNNCNENTIFTVISELLRVLNIETEVDKFNCFEYKSYEEKLLEDYPKLTSNQIKKLYLLRIVLTKKV